MFDPMLLCLYLARTALVQPQVSATLSTKIALGIVTLIQPKSKKNKSSYNGEESTLRWSGGVDFVLGYTEPIASSTPKSTRRDNKWIPQDESWIEMKSSISPIMDGAGAYDTVRPLAYQDAQVFLLCFSVVDPNSLESALNKWHPEVRHHCANTSVILCGCQSDLRNDKQTLALLEDKFNTPITAEQGVSVGRQIGATTYVETSSKTSAKVVRDAFEVAALAALGKLNKNKPLCPGGGATRSKSKVDLKSELKDRAKSCSLM